MGLGNPDITHEHLKALATLLVNAEKNGDPTQNRRPRFFTYDDKPSFNLISGLMQAKEDIWQKNSIIKLQTDMRQLLNGNRRPSAPGSVANITELASQMKTFKTLQEAFEKEVNQLKQEVKILRRVKQNKRGVARRNLNFEIENYPRTNL